MTLKSLLLASALLLIIILVLGSFLIGFKLIFKLCKALYNND